MLRSLARLAGITRKRLVGKDLDGNKYFEVDAIGTDRPRRSVEFIEHKQGGVGGNTGMLGWSALDLNVQWAAWLRHTRNDGNH